MKRLILAAIFLALAAGLCVVCILGMRSQTAHLTVELDQLEQTYDAGDTEQAGQLAERFSADVKAGTSLFPLFLRHSDILVIDESASLLPVWLKNGDEIHFRAELTRCRMQIQRLHEAESPSLKNIL